MRQRKITGEIIHLLSYLADTNAGKIKIPYRQVKEHNQAKYIGVAESTSYPYTPEMVYRATIQQSPYYEGHESLNNEKKERRQFFINLANCMNLYVEGTITKEEIK